MQEATRKEVPICPLCGGSSITADGLLEWDVEAQEWVVMSVLDTRNCEDCDGEEVEPEWIPVEQALTLA